MCVSVSARVSVSVSVRVHEPVVRDAVDAEVSSGDLHLGALLQDTSE